MIFIILVVIAVVIALCFTGNTAGSRAKDAQLKESWRQYNKRLNDPLKSMTVLYTPERIAEMAAELEAELRRERRTHRVKAWIGWSIVLVLVGFAAYTIWNSKTQETPKSYSQWYQEHPEFHQTGIPEEYSLQPPKLEGLKQPRELSARFLVVTPMPSPTMWGEYLLNQALANSELVSLGKD